MIIAPLHRCGTKVSYTIVPVIFFYGHGILEIDLHAGDRGIVSDVAQGIGDGAMMIFYAALYNSVRSLHENLNPYRVIKRRPSHHLWWPNGLALLEQQAWIIDTGS